MDIRTLYLEASVDASTQYATVYRRDTFTPVGTLQQRRVLSLAPNWRVYGVDGGTEIGQGFYSARQAMFALEKTLYDFN